MRLRMVSDAEVDGSTRAVFARAWRRYGWLPNTVRVMARGSVAAELYLTAGDLNAAGTLTAVERELLAVLVATHNGCAYCRIAHGLAARALHVDPAGILAAGRATSIDPRTAAILGLAAKVLAHAGRLSDEEVTRARTEGLDDTTMLDIVSVIAENMLGNTINNLANTILDPVLQPAAEQSDSTTADAR